jgi:hypothetical protein
LFVPVDSGSSAASALASAAAHRAHHGAGVVGGAGDRAELDELQHRPAPGDPAPLLQGAQHARRHAHRVRRDEHPLDPGRAGRRDQPEHHVRLLGVREHGRLRDQPADVAPGHRVRDHAQQRARHDRQPRTDRRRAHLPVRAPGHTGKPTPAA